MLSDGRVVRHQLAKMSCLGCGAAFHASAMTDAEIRTIYDDDYTLAQWSPKSDALRARAYCSWIRAEAATPLNVLEVGCGSGALLSELLAAWPEANGFGLDPALPDAGRSNGRLRLARGTAEEIPLDGKWFDLIIAVNVIEHTLAPATFLKALRSRLAPNGQIIIICPDTHPANLELLFFDHFYSLTAPALLVASKAASLAIRKQVSAPREIGNFQMVVLKADAARPVTPPLNSPSDLHAERHDYLARWARLDQTLLDRAAPCSRLVAFGCGQTAALLRAYAPRTWSLIDAIAVDDPSDAWRLGPVVVPYHEVRQRPGCSVLVATSPHVQTAVAGRLSQDDLRPITWNDLILC